jgi:ABC-type lipoprotein release transport system permease subunit
VGVALAITLSTIMFSISEGINTSTKELIDETDIELFVFPPSSNPILQEFTKYLDLDSGRELAEKIREGNPKIRAASPWLTEGIYISNNIVEDNNLGASGDEKQPKIYSITGKGYVPELQGNFGTIEQVTGTDLPTPSDPFFANGTYAGGYLSENFTHEIVLNKNLAEMMQVTVGDIVFVNSLGIPFIMDNSSYNTWLENSTWFEVQGIIIERTDAPSILSASMHLSELQYITGKHRMNFFGAVLTDFVNEIYIDLYDPGDTSAVKKWLEEDFEDSNRISVITAGELANEFNSFLDIFKGFSTMIIIITSAVVILFISTIMMISVQEQRREIGMMRAIGISKSTVVRYILVESVVICLIGFIIGLVMGYVGSSVLEEIILSTEDTIPVGVELTTITPDLVFSVSFITILIGIIAGVVPAAWAANLAPVESIRKI